MNQFQRAAFITLCTLVMAFAFGGNEKIFVYATDIDADTLNSSATEINASDIGVYIDGSEVDFPDAKPYISNSRTLVPARFVVEQLGASIDWDNDTGTVSINKDENSITLVIGSTEMVRNGVLSPMDVAPVITDSRTMVPLRFVSEQLGVVVEWDIENNSAMLTTEKPETSITTPETSITGPEPISTTPESPITAPVVTRGEGKEISVGCSPEEMILYAKRYLGVPYAYNGTTPDGFDCSGFTQYVVAHFGGMLPHSSGDQYYYGISVEREYLEPGDLVFFETSDNPMKIGHVGIYIGDGEFIHSPQAGDTVKITNLSNVYFNPRFYGAIRMNFEQ